MPPTWSSSLRASARPQVPEGVGGEEGDQARGEDPLGGGGPGSTGHPGAGGSPGCGPEDVGGPAQGGPANRRLGERSELSAGATWDESNPSGRAASFDC